MEVKNQIFNINRICNSALENIIFYLDVLKSILFEEDKSCSRKKSHIPTIFYPMTPPRSLVLKLWAVWEGGD